MQRWDNVLQLRSIADETLEEENVTGNVALPSLSWSRPCTRRNAPIVAGRHVPLDDAETVAAIRAGRNPRACWQALYERYAHRVVGLAFKLVGDPHVARDLLQSTFLKAMEKVDALANPKAFKSWLLSIAYNEAMLHHRKAGNEPPIDPDTMPPRLVEGDPEARLCARALSEAIRNRLRGEQRMVWILRYEQCFSYEDIHRATGIALNTVRSHLRRAKKRIRESPILQKLLLLAGALLFLMGGAL